MSKIGKNQYTGINEGEATGNKKESHKTPNVNLKTGNDKVNSFSLVKSTFPSKQTTKNQKQEQIVTKSNYLYFYAKVDLPRKNNQCE